MANLIYSYRGKIVHSDQPAAPIVSALFRLPRFRLAKRPPPPRLQLLELGIVAAAPQLVLLQQPRQAELHRLRGLHETRREERRPVLLKASGQTDSVGVQLGFSWGSVGVQLGFSWGSVGGLGCQLGFSCGSNGVVCFPTGRNNPQREN